MGRTRVETVSSSCWSLHRQGVTGVCSQTDETGAPPGLGGRRVEKEETYGLAT